MDELFRGLTEPQRQAVEHIDGALLILAGPGSGKTRVVTHRIANMLRQGIPAWQIAALTFTNKAADEMRMRVQSLAPDQPVWMGTFHRFCARLLRRYATMIGLSENYSIYDATDARQAIKRAIEAAKVSTSHTSPEQIAASISRAKNRLVTPEMMLNQSLRHNEQIAARVYPVYQRQLITANAVDFDDLLLHVAVLLRENPELRSELDAKYRYILVDEYQDTNLAQYAIVRALSIDHPNLSVTGDPDQSIYGWRGADINNILDFEKDYPSVKIVRLEENYRSTPNILRVADQLIRHNRRRKHKELFTSKSEGQPVVLKLYEDGYQEADDIADQIATTILEQQRRPRDFAIFCRMNALTRSLEHAMRRRSLPYQIVNGTEFYQRKEIKDLLAYLHLINNPAHDVALQRVINTPARGIGDKTIERLREFADSANISLLSACRQAGLIESIPKRSATKVAAFVALYDALCVKATATTEDLLLHLLEAIRYREYLERTVDDQQDNSPLANVDELVTAAVEFDRQHPEDGSLEEFLEQIALVSSTDDWEDNTDRVTLMTLHASKGLEFPVVFIIGVEDDLIPHFRSKEDDAQLEEERRLLFVGITRAQERLQLSYCKRRLVRGDNRPVIASPFLIELPREDLRYIEPDAIEDYFDDDPYGSADYPDSWDLPSEGSSSVNDDELCQLDDQDRVSPVKAAAAMKSFPAGVRTAAQMAAKLPSGGLATFRPGQMVYHPKYGDGKIATMTGRGPKCTVTVAFEEGETKTFRLAFAELEAR
ncbi:MAG: ATP-dependent helicase [Planctomycetaceae bacterium]